MIITEIIVDEEEFLEVMKKLKIVVSDRIIGKYTLYNMDNLPPNGNKIQLVSLKYRHIGG